MSVRIVSDGHPSTSHVYIDGTELPLVTGVDIHVAVGELARAYIAVIPENVDIALPVDWTDIVSVCPYCGHAEKVEP